jgi:hypothetical protein
MKEGFLAKLLDLGWEPEKRFPGERGEEAAALTGKFDTYLDLSAQGHAPFVVE